MKKQITLGILMTLPVFAQAGFGKILLRDVVSTNPGYEMIIPYLTANSTYSTFTIQYKVYPVGKTTKLFSTTSKSFAVPAMDCMTVVQPEYGVDVQPFGDSETTGPNQSITVNLWRGCSSRTTGEWIESNVTFMYGVNVSAAGKTPWVKTVKTGGGMWPLAVNVDADSALETLYLYDPLNDVPGQFNYTVIEPATGTANVAQTLLNYANSYYAESQ